MKYLLGAIVCAVVVVAGYAVLRQYQTSSGVIDSQVSRQSVQSTSSDFYENTAFSFRAITPPVWSVKEYTSEYGESFVRIISPNYSEKDQYSPSGSYIYIGWIGGGGTQMYYSSPESYVASEGLRMESMCSNCDSVSRTIIGGKQALLVIRDEAGKKSTEIYTARPVDMSLEPKRDAKRTAYLVGDEPTADTGYFKEMIIAFTDVPAEIQAKFIEEFKFLD